MLPRSQKAQKAASTASRWQRGFISGSFTVQRCWMGVETKGGITRGKTVTDCWSDAQKEANVELVLDVDREKFAAKVKALMAVY